MGLGTGSRVDRGRIRKLASSLGCRVAVLDSQLLSRQGEHDGKDPSTARKVQKADREKLRRDRLNEQFSELGSTLDPSRPKNDKATILADTIQMLKDLTIQVDKLKAEYASLSEESRELTQEKNELREEKASLKSDMDNLNDQYQQRVRFMYPWAAVDPSVVMASPPPYSYPMPVPLPINPSLQPYHFFHTQAPGAIPNPSKPQVEQPSSSQRIPHPHPSSNRSQNACRKDSRSKSSDQHQQSCAERSGDCSDVVTELELKTPGSAVTSSHLKAAQVQDCSEGSKGNQCLPQGKGSSNADRSSSSSRVSSSSAFPESSSNSVGNGSVANS